MEIEMRILITAIFILFLSACQSHARVASLAPPERIDPPPVTQLIDIVSRHIIDAARQRWGEGFQPRVENIETDGNNYCGHLRLANFVNRIRFIAMEYKGALVIYWSWAHSNRAIFVMQWDSLCSDLFSNKK